MLPPAVAVGWATIVSVLLEVAFAHGALPSEVKVNVTGPASLRPGVYVAKVIELALAIVPEPVCVHTIPELFVADDPAVMLTGPELKQVETAAPATAVADLFTITV